MIWLWYEGSAHAVVSLEETDGIVEWKAACGRADDYNVEDEQGIPNMRAVKTPSDRPFGPDTDGECHRIAKGWTVNPDTIPAGLFDPVEPVRTVMSAEERRASIEGRRATEPVPMPGDRPSAAPRAAPARRGTVRAVPDDLEGGDEPEHQPGTVVDGALVIPAGPRASKKKRDPDLEIDS